MTALNEQSDRKTSSDILDDEQATRALQAFVRAEFQAPVAAIAGFVDLLAEDAARAGHDEYGDDLGRMKGAAARLSNVVGGFLEGRHVDCAGRSGGEFSGRHTLRHDLRTPITSIVGYGELIVEEAREKGHRDLLEPLADVFDAARRLLSDIDRLAEYADDPDGNVKATDAALAPTILQQAIEVVRNLSVEAPDAQQALVGRILVVDDNPSILDLVARRLEREGHEVLTSGSGEEALQIAAWARLDLMLLDLMMPEVSGLEVLRRLRETPKTNRLPVIMISALDEVEAAVRCIQAGADDYLAKPLDPTLLRARIGSSLERKFLRDREQEALHRLRSEQDRSDRLLRNVLPDVIVDRMRRGETVIADHFDDVSILFCDLVGFTDLTSRLAPADTLALLNDIFSGFDRLAMAHGLEKVKTIGDAYMAAGGLPEPRPDHARDVAATALGMGSVVAEVSRKRGIPLDIRIGIEKGPAVAGIIGEQKFFYDVWGDSVNTASRLESTALPGEIQISAAMRDALSPEFHCESRGTLDLKGKGPTEVYVLRGWSGAPEAA